MKILLTGCAGFIGSHVLDRLLADGHTVVGVDNFDPFYPRALKQASIEAHLRWSDGEVPEAWSNGEIEKGSGVPTARSGGGVENGSNGVEDQHSRTPSLHHANTPPPLHPSTPPPPSSCEPEPVEGQHSTSKGSFELVESDLADETTYTKLKFIAESLTENSPPSQGGVPEGRGGFDAVIHLAAKAGVRPSIEDPVGYQRANVIATQNLLEFAREEGIRQFVFASSSSVYGVNPRVPWREDDHVLQPISPYASTKVSGELLGHVYSHLYGIRFLALRFFTVFGPRQRPDLAINKFVRLIEAGEPIPVFGDGSTRRDYTYVGDVVDGIVAAVERAVTAGPPVPSTGNRELETEQPGSGTLPPYAVVNVGNNRTVSLEEMISTIEAVVGKKAIIDRQPQQPGDVPQTWADVSKAGQLFGYQPKTSFREGIEKFVAWQHTQNDLLP
jgi:UDP-glucuronate 4-epimerase